MTPDKKVRKLTVVNRSQWPHYRQVPEVRMSGDWLARAGFAAGCRLAVEVEHGRMVVTVTAPPGPIPYRRMR